MVKYLLTIPECDPNCTDNNGCTPLTLANDTETIRCLLKNGATSEKMYNEFLADRSTLPTPPAISVFMVGDKGAGKSTLAKALMTEKSGISHLTARLTKVGGVTAKTAGIECHQIQSQHIGNLHLYDIAGHREFHSSHDTVIRNTSSGGIFLFLLILTRQNLIFNRQSFFGFLFFKTKSLPIMTNPVSHIYCSLVVMLISLHQNLI